MLGPTPRRGVGLAIKAAPRGKSMLEGQRATGIEYVQDDQVHQATARREVILSAGSIGSPMILQLSGIGPGQVLQDAGVAVAHALPGVGENLQDHLEVYFQFKCKQPITLNARLGPLSKLMAAG